MKLSEINTATRYPITIPSNQQVTTFRPFVVKEEKSLLVAHQSEDAGVQLATLESVIRSCVENAPKELTTFDVEYLFLMIRAKSVDENSIMIGTCGKCSEKTEFAIDLTQAEVTELRDRKLKIADDFVILMKYPSISTITTLAKETDQVLKKTKTIAASIETVYYKDVVFHTKDCEMQELIDFLDNRTDAEFELITDFIDNIPTVKLDSGFKCPHCEAQNEIHLRTLSDFF